MRPDTLFVAQRHVDVRYEENRVVRARRRRRSPGSCRSCRSRTARSTSRAINQSQSTSFTRPQLGFQGSSTLTTGVTGQFNWDAPALTQPRQPAAVRRVQSRVAISHSGRDRAAAIRSSSRAIRARRTSRRSTATAAPRSRSPIIAWLYSSLPAYGNSLASRFGGAFFEPIARGDARLADQRRRRPTGRRLVVHAEQHRSAAHVRRQRDRAQRAGAVAHAAAARPGRPLRRRARSYNWTDNGLAAAGHAGFGSIRTVLSPAGLDLTRGEFLEFWTLLDTSAIARASNPTLIFDFGDVSENVAALFARDADDRPTTTDSRQPFTGKRLRAFDNPVRHGARSVLATRSTPRQRHRASRRRRRHARRRSTASGAHRATNVRVCRAAPGALDVLGDPRTELHGGQQPARRRRHRSRQRAELLERAARERADAALRRRSERAERRTSASAGRSPTRCSFAAQPQARTRHWVLVQHSVQDADRFAQRRQSAHACARCGSRSCRALVSPQGQDAEGRRSCRSPSCR